MLRRLQQARGMAIFPNVLFSIDTFLAPVAEACLDAGPTGSMMSPVALVIRRCGSW